MAFVASLLAYVFGTVGIVVAFAMGYEVLVAAPSSEQIAASAAIAAPQHPNAVTKADTTSARPQALGEHPAVHDQTARSREREARDIASARRRKLAANQRQRIRRMMVPEPRAHASQWAYQPLPDNSLYGLFDRQAFDER